MVTGGREEAAGAKASPEQQGSVELQGRGRYSLPRERWKEWGEEKKGRRKKKKRRGRWGAGQLGPTSKFLTCGIVPHH